MSEHKEGKKKLHLSKVLGPMHVWALGVGVVLVGEFMGWNFTVAKGGTLGAIIACWVVGILYLTISAISTEMGSVIPEAGGQYAMAKYLLGPLAAFNVGLMLVFEYVMLLAADLLVVGELLNAFFPTLNTMPFMLFTLLILSFLNYRGVLSTLTINLIITAIAFISIVVLVVYTVFFGSADAAAQLATLSNGLSHGFLGIIAALQFGMWFYLGIEGTAMSAEECRSTHRALPLGSLIAMVSLLVGATLTWFVCSSLIPPDVLGSSVYPLFDAAKETGVPVLIALLLIGTVFSCLASSNGCIIDSSRALFSMSRDTLMPEFFSALHPKHKTPYRATLFLVPIAAVFAFTGMLDHVITFSIISALYVYLYSAIMILRFRKMYPLGTIKRGYTVPAYKLLAAVIIAIVAATMFGMYLGYWIDILAATLFYAICSVWFLKFRSGSIDTHKFFSAENHDWPKPKKF